MNNIDLNGLGRSFPAAPRTALDHMTGGSQFPGVVVNMTHEDNLERARMGDDWLLRDYDLLSPRTRDSYPPLSCQRADDDRCRGHLGGRDRDHAARDGHVNDRALQVNAGDR